MCWFGSARRRRSWGALLPPSLLSSGRHIRSDESPVAHWRWRRWLSPTSRPSPATTLRCVPCSPAAVVAAAAVVVVAVAGAGTVTIAAMATTNTIATTTTAPTPMATTGTATGMTAIVGATPAGDTAASSKSIATAHTTEHGSASTSGHRRAPTGPLPRHPRCLAPIRPSSRRSARTLARSHGGRPIHALRLTRFRGHRNTWGQAPLGGWGPRAGESSTVH